MSLVNSDMLPAIGGIILPLMGRKQIIQMNQQDCLHVFHTDCRLLDDHLKTSKYLIGDTVTIADLFSTTMISFAVMVFHKMLAEKYPYLLKWFNEVYGMDIIKNVAGPLHLLDVPYPTLDEEK